MLTAHIFFEHDINVTGSGQRFDMYDGYTRSMHTRSAYWHINISDVQTSSVIYTARYRDNVPWSDMDQMWI